MSRLCPWDSSDRQAGPHARHMEDATRSSPIRWECFTSNMLIFEMKLFNNLGKTACVIPELDFPVS